MVYNRNTILKFGKHKGKSIQEIYTGRNVLTEEEIYLLTGVAGARLRSNKKLPTSGVYNYENKTEISIFAAEIGLEEDDNYSKLLMEINGFPDYISWCMMNHDKFYLEEKEVEFLETLEVYTLHSLNIKELSFDSETKSYCVDADNPCFAIAKYSFSSQAKLDNLAKKHIGY